MYADEQVVLLLKFALTIGPIAGYFLALGYLNAQPSPRVLTGRADFLLLTVVFVPILVWGLLLLASVSSMALLPAGCAVLIGLYLLLPPRHSSWVVYNITQKQFQRALVRSFERAGRSAIRRESDHAGQTAPAALAALPVWLVPSLGLRIRISPFPLLQNVTCYFERLDGQPVEPGQLEPFRQSLQASLGSTHTLPSASAACFLLIGTVMLTAPLLLMARHMDTIVKVVSSLFA